MKSHNASLPDQLADFWCHHEAQSRWVMVVWVWIFGAVHP